MTDEVRERDRRVDLVVRDGTAWTPCGVRAFRPVCSRFGEDVFAFERVVLSVLRRATAAADPAIVAVVLFDSPDLVHWSVD